MAAAGGEKAAPARVSAGPPGFNDSAKDRTRTARPPIHGALDSGSRGGHYLLAIMMFSYMLNFLDRQIVNIVAEPIRRDLGLADWQLGLLTGTAFAVLYSVATIPIARLSDRGNRVWILTASVGLWSLCTAMCGLATRFWQLLVARLFVGLGEAGFAAPAQSLITDSVPPERRASALGIYSLGVPLGSLVGMALGGIVAQAWGWRWAFLLPGALGVVLAVVILTTIREPRVGRPQPPREQATWRLVKWLATNRSFVCLTLGASLSAFAGFSTQAFFASFYLRAHGAAFESGSGGLGPIALVGIMIGLILGLGGMLGTYLGGLIADRARQRWRGSYLLVPAVSMIVLAPLMVATFLADGLAASLVAMVAAAIFKSTWYAPTYAAANSLVRPHERSIAVALLLLVVNMIGLGLGPLLTGSISTALSYSLGSVEGLRWALAGVAVPCLLSGWFYWLGSRSFEAERAS